MFQYLKFFNYYAFALFAVACLWLGGWAIPLGFLAFVSFYVLGDLFFGDDLSEPALLNKTALNCFLYGSVPLTILVLLSAMWLVTPYEPKWVANMATWLNYDFITAKQQTEYWQLIISVPFIALVLSGVATVVAHEFVHRVNSKVAVTTGRWLMATSLDANFSIEHVFNHHVKVATPEDPVTAPRGRNVYVHFVHALIKTNRASWAIEKKRLRKRNQSPFTLSNQCITGWLMSVALAGAAYFLASWAGVFMYLGVGVVAKFILEVVNYMEHYGLVRDPRQPVKPRHSWNSNKRMSCYAMFNLPRHSHHHAQGAVPFEKLKAMPDAPMMIAGYISTIGIAIIPPLWFKLMDAKLKDWDENYANDREKQLLAEQNSKNWQKHQHSYSS